MSVQFRYSKLFTFQYSNNEIENLCRNILYISIHTVHCKNASSNFNGLKKVPEIVCTLVRNVSFNFNGNKFVILQTCPSFQIKIFTQSAKIHLELWLREPS